MKNKKIILTLLALISAIFFTLIYLAGRILIFAIAKYCWYEKIVGGTLLLSEAFILVHGIGYILEILKITFREKSFIEKEYLLRTKPKVAVVIPSYNEPIAILERTITACYNMSYEKKYIFLLDDTRYEQEGKEVEKLQDYKKQIEELCKKWKIGLFRRKWRGAKAGIINDFLSLIREKPKKGFVYKNFDKKIDLSEIKYLSVFDADQNPFIDFLEPLVARLEDNPKLAFIQTPQYYTNFEKNKVAKASGLQQAIFYEFICEGKSVSDAMFCCGTNVVFRIEALEDIGGFDEKSVTEDFATSLKFHLNKWSTRYFSKVGAFGMGPEDLGSYFKQQYRWALGTIGLLKSIFFEFLKNPKKMILVRWWEYFLSGTYYLIGFVFFVLMVCPILFLLFNVPSYFADIKVYAAIFIPYFIIAMFIYFGTLRKRGYSAKDLLSGQLLLTQCFLVYMRASCDAFIGKKKKFEITIKGESKSLPFIALWPQVLMSILCFIAIIWGLNRIIYEKHYIFALSANIFWCLYNFVILSFIFYFNKPVIQEGISEKA